MTALHTKDDWKRGPQETALRAPESVPVVHGVAQALESSLAVTNTRIRHEIR